MLFRNANLQRRSFVLASACVLIASRLAAAASPATSPSVTFTSDAFGNNFAADSGQVTLQLGDSIKVNGGAIRVDDEVGHKLSEIAIAPGSRQVAVPLNGKGFYSLSASVTTDGSDVVTAKTTASVVGPLLPNDVRMNSPFGFFSVKGNTPLPAVAGGTWERLFVPIHGIRQDANGDPMWWSPQPPEPKYVHEVDGQPTPLRWVGVFMYPPPWTVAPERVSKLSNFAVYPPADWKKFAKVVTFAAKYYSKWVDYFEPINEPDANWRGTDEELVQYHAAIADAVHAANSKVKVVGPCLSSIDIPRLRTLAKLGIFDHLDGVSIHAYSNAAPPEGKWLASIHELKALMRSLGKGDLPLVVSEYGWQTQNGDWARPVDELTQARYAARSLTLLAAEQVSAINYFCLRYEDPRISYVQGWSVVEHDYTPRPAYAAIATVGHWLAGVQGAGTVLHPAPDSYLVLFKKGSGSVAVAWTTRGQQVLRIPGKSRAINDMTGRSIEPSPQGTVTISESPTFIELDDAALPSLQLQQPVSVVRGEAAELPGDWAGATVPVELSLSGTQVKASDAAAAGEYLILARRSDGSWAAAPVDVLPRFDVESATTMWPTESENPFIRMKVRSHGSAVNILPSVRLKGAAPRFGPRIDVAADQTATVDVPLDGLPLGRHWAGEAYVEARVADRVETSSAPLDVSVVPGSHIDNPDVAIDWTRVPKITSQGWSQFGEGTDVTPLAPENCSATLQWGWSTKGLHFHIEVRDDTHLQLRDPQQIWQQDSLQFAFDSDADKPWQANLNNDVVGLNGHRVFEYGAALSNGQPVTSRWRDEIVKLSADVRPIAADITQQGDRTVYELTFPWGAFGLQQAPAAGTSIGFDMVVNDVDSPKDHRHGLEIFSGINSSKDPEKFGRLLLR